MVVTLRAPAKLTVSLKLVGLRADGYHLIDAEMVSLDLADVLTVDGDGPDGMTVGGPFADGVPTDDRNLVRRAMTLAGRTGHVHLHKAVPAGGGLGGGSSDAAAILRWAGLTDPLLAAQLGADVPFCLSGGRARVTGIGELLEPLPFAERTFTLVLPPFGVSTVAAYRAWDALGGPVTDGPNDLEAGALAVVPALADVRDRIAHACGQSPVLAGSGSTWFVEGEHRDRLAAAMPDCIVVVTRTDRPLERAVGDT
jgi:4-diphosphocytidyl-2-C-methyl-D-erythritol kinase